MAQPTTQGLRVHPETMRLIARGEFQEAEQRLKRQVSDPQAPATTPAAIQLEILARIRHDFPWDEQAIFEQLKEQGVDADASDLARWRDVGDLQFRTIDGTRRYFRRAVGNLWRFNAEARLRRGESPATSEFAMEPLVAQLLARRTQQESDLVQPIRHRVVYRLTISEDEPLWQPGSKVAVWLPYPQAYRQQTQVQLVRTDPEVVHIADENVPQRTLYFEKTIGNDDQQRTFLAEFTFVTSAYVPQLDDSQVEQYQTSSELYQEFTAARLPHIALTPAVRKLAAEIVKNENNPLAKARAVFHWVSHNIPWCGEREYSTIDSLSQKGLAARRGDCGVQGTTFITLCRAAGVPARWQSGWQTKPGHENMHDWTEFYVEPWGWLPADPSYGVLKHESPEVRDFFCGHLDPYRMIVNLDYGRRLQPPKTSFRSEPNDFQRGEVEIDGRNLYFDRWKWHFEVEVAD
ncbi:MAG: transglutaminase domain-containing protein [Planctomycetales bacterium]|nr:transglutaminase domain-containing protein [Planctomycetales bacterium]